MGKLIKTGNSDRYEFYGTFNRLGLRTVPHKGLIQTIQFDNIYDEYFNYTCQYTIFDYLKTFSQLPLMPGDLISFRARVIFCEDPRDPYRINQGRFKHCRLFYPTKARIIQRPVKRLYY